jgi:hypothetical protein
MILIRIQSLNLLESDVFGTLALSLPFASDKIRGFCFHYFFTFIYLF